MYNSVRTLIRQSPLSGVFVSRVSRAADLGLHVGGRRTSTICHILRTSHNNLKAGVCVARERERERERESRGHVGDFYLKLLFPIFIWSDVSFFCPTAMIQSFIVSRIFLLLSSTLIVLSWCCFLWSFIIHNEHQSWHGGAFRPQTSWLFVQTYSRGKRAPNSYPESCWDGRCSVLISLLGGNKA